MLTSPESRRHIAERDPTSFHRTRVSSDRRRRIEPERSAVPTRREPTFETRIFAHACAHRYQCGAGESYVGPSASGSSGYMWIGRSQSPISCRSEVWRAAILAADHAVRTTSDVRQTMCRELDDARYGSAPLRRSRSDEAARRSRAGPTMERCARTHRSTRGPYRASRS